MNNLTIEEKRAKIAEACALAEIKTRNAKPIQQPAGTMGYKCDLSRKWILQAEDGGFLGMNYDTPEQAITGLVEDHRRSNYFNDLNAAHEMEKSVPRHLWSDYTMALRRIVQHDCDSEPHYVIGAERSQLIADIWFYGATAAQRAEAFGLTLRLWL